MRLRSRSFRARVRGAASALAACSVLLAACAHASEVHVGADEPATAATSAEARSAPSTTRAPLEAQRMGGATHSGRTGARLAVRADTALRVTTLAQNLGRVRAQPLLDARGLVYVASDDGSLRVLDAQGQLQWRFEARGRIRATPVLGRDGSVYVGDESGALTALTAEGVVRWHAQLGAPIVAALALSELAAAPATVAASAHAEERVFVAADGLYAFSSRGALLFHIVTADTLRGAPAVHPSGFVVVGTTHGRLLAIDFDGHARWDVPAGAAVESGASIGDDGTLAIGNSIGELWSFDAQGHGRALFASQSSILTTPATAPDGTIVFGAEDGRMRALRPNGELIWSFDAGAPITTSPRLDLDGRVVFATRDGLLYVLDAHGSLLARVHLGSASAESLTLAPDGSLFAAVAHGALLVVR